jgi:asparagine synthase (glutamine-hydrolysing)
MCGICGFVVERRPDYDPDAVVVRMADTLSHRGPDGAGYLKAMPAWFGHRRLKIIDLETGDQPIFNEDGTVAVVFNGEIYNYRELTRDLAAKGHTFRTRSDTEVIVHLWEEVGTDLPNHLNGMFAIALWDTRKRELFLARDRMGKKPLYWAATPQAFVFGSELRAVMQHPGVERKLSPEAVNKYLLFDTVPAPHTILSSVRKLEPGTWLTYREGTPRLGRYWDISFPSPHEKVPSLADASERLVSLLKDAVDRRLISDVPLGVFLSGGIDSSIVTALMCEIGGAAQVKTFSVGFTDATFDESQYAKLVAQKFGTRHHSQTLTADTMLELLPGIIARLDEPLADGSLIPTYFLSKFTREKVTVALGGDGGDELALGYPTFQAHRIARWYSWLPRFLRAAVAAVVRSLPVSTSNISFDYKAKQFVSGMDYDRFSRHFVWIGAIPPDARAGLMAPDFAPGSADAVLEDIPRHLAACQPRDDFDALTYLYAKLYMCDDILMKVDRAAMMNSLEARAPLLDYRVVEHLTSLPTHMKLNGFTMKYILKRAFASRLPGEILHRKKKGFGVPIADWLKGELRPWVEDLLSPRSVSESGIFEPSAVQALWTDHLQGVTDNRKPLWSMVVLLLWVRENLRTAP